MAFFFSRDTKVFMRWTYDGTNDALYELPVLDGFSFSQATNTSEITLNEAAATDGSSKRGRAMFTDSFAPAEWSFNTYMRPTSSDTGNVGVSKSHAGNGDVFAVEGPLWAAMSANNYNNAIGANGTADYANNAGTYEPDHFPFHNSNRVTLGVFDLFFVLGAAGDSTDATFDTGTNGVSVYKVANCSVGSASIDFDIEGIAQIAWSGNGQTVEEIDTLNTAAGAAASEGGSTLGIINEGVSATNNYIRQKLTDLTMSFVPGSTTGTLGALDSNSNANQAYSVTLTGGNITIENNLNYLTPETIGSVNLPLGHVMGTRSVSGNFTCYLNDVSNGSMDLFERLQESRSVITNSFSLEFGIGGSTSTPRANVKIDNAHLELPAHSLEDVISVDVNFHGLPTDLSATTNNATNEVEIEYFA